MDDSKELERMYTEYRERRKDLLYYKYVRSLIAICAASAESILDVGSGGIDVISHCTNVPYKVSIDSAYPFKSREVEGITGDFFSYEPDRKFDIVGCFQVIEHVEEAEEFCRKLLRLSKGVVIVSVPYMWKKGAVKNHVQDPVDLEKLAGWFGFEPSFCNIVDEMLVAVFLADGSVRENLLKQNGKEFSGFDRKWNCKTECLKCQ